MQELYLFATIFSVVMFVICGTGIIVKSIHGHKLKKGSHEKNNSKRNE